MQDRDKKLVDVAWQARHLGLVDLNGSFWRDTAQNRLQRAEDACRQLCEQYSRDPKVARFLRDYPFGDQVLDEFGVRSRAATSPYRLLINSFLRPNCLRRLVDSIRWYYPDAPITVGDQSLRAGQTLSDVGEDFEYVKALDNVRWLQLPFDTGLAATRIAMVRDASEPIVIQLDDDYVFDEETKIERLVEILDRNREIDVAAGILRMDGKHAHSWDGLFEIKDRKLRIRPLDTPWCQQGPSWFRQTHLAWNFYAGRRSSFLRYPRDPQFKIVYEHMDHFLGLWRDGAKVVQTPNVLVGHLSAPPATSEYPKWRWRKEQFRQAFLDKWQIDEMPDHPAKKIPGIEVRDSRTAVRRRPSGRANIVVLGVGSSNTRSTVAQLRALGWHTGETDQYEELPHLRVINRRIHQEGEFDQAAAEQLLDSLPDPWVIKDPRFCETLGQWRWLLERYRPALLYVTKDLERVRLTSERKGWGQHAATCHERQARAEYLYRNWPWAKAQIDVEQIAAAVQLFDVQRALGEQA